MTAPPRSVESRVKPDSVRVLLIEDDPTDAELARRTLAPNYIAFSSDVVTSRAETEKRLREAMAGNKSYDVIIADFRLRGWRGLEAVQLVREMGLDIPVILLTGFLGDEAAISAIKNGAADCVLKDRLVQLPHAVERALEERALAKNHRRIESERQRILATYRSLVEHAPIGILRVATDGTCVLANPALAHMLGYDSCDELQGVSFAEDVYENADDAKRVLVDAEQSGNHGSDVRWRRRDGSVITVHVRGRVGRDDTGSIESYEILAEDVTTVRALEDQLRQAQKMEAVGQLTSGIAHDFRNLLTVIVANTDLVLRELASSSTALVPDLEVVRGAALRGNELIHKLLGFSRREPLQPRCLDLAQLVEELVPLIRRTLPETISIQYESEGPGLPVVVDPNAVEQVVLNLVTNARDAMPRGGVLELRLEELDSDQSSRLDESRDTPLVCLSISDDGIGMSPETKRRIFEPFFTTKPAATGTGLGMAMVYGLMEQHNGAIEVESEEGLGTTMRLLFPRCQRGTPSGDEPAVVEIQPVALGGEETVLVVEDEPGILRVTRRVLQAAGYTVLTAEDGEVALRTIEGRHQEIDLVITDLVLPKLGGRELHEVIRQQGTDLPLLIMSGYTARDIRDTMSLPEGLPFLQKPWTVEDLLARVRTVLDSTA